ncbi:hypothetical protein N0V88_004808 [Collariella sp. IMI 366227]|nr:hypothetical protein N0V88_004808 [Collariella sp. IMI 366227]
MASAARKRPRAEPEDNKAECPFSIKVVDPKDKEQKKKKRRRTDTGEDDETNQRISLQLSPFAPCGKFRTNESMDLYYQVEPARKWTDMTRYNSFVLNGIKYYSEGFIYVANDSSIERQKAVNNNEPMQPRKKSDDDWVARILEIRASDEHHVYARVYWMYWPDELLPGTHDGKKIVQGRQPYHGMNELIASNHMDIINVVSVTSQATVKQWYEENDEEVLNALYWRQAYDVRANELSSVELVCSCNTPGNPDKMLIGCSEETCKKWMHEQCILDDALRATYKRLGTDKPHLAPVTAKIEEEEEGDGSEGKRPLSPTETGAEGSTQQSIDVKAEGAPSDTMHVSTAAKPSSVEADSRQSADDEDAQAAPEDALPSRPAAQARAMTSASETPDTAPAATTTTTTTTTTTPSKKASTATAKTPGSTGRRPGRPKKKALDAGVDEARPWQGLFEASLKTADIGPPLVEIRDLRTGPVIVYYNAEPPMAINCEAEEEAPAPTLSPRALRAQQKAEQKARAAETPKIPAKPKILAKAQQQPTLRRLPPQPPPLTALPPLAPDADPEHPQPNPEEPFNLSDLSHAFDRLESRYTEDLKKLRTGGRFNADTIGAIPVQPDKKSTQSYPLRELATVAPPRRTAESSVKPIISAVQRSDEFNQQPQRSEDNPLELTMTVEPERAEALVKRAKDVCQQWRTKVREEAHKRGELHKRWRAEKVIVGDDLHSLKGQLQKMQDERMKVILGKEKEAVGLIMAKAS